MSSKIMTKAQELIEVRLAELEPGSQRYEVLAHARDFKAAWIGLGEKLTTVLEKELFQDWGYSTFEDYCQEEPRLRKGTAFKLVRSYSFLRDNEPDMLNTKSVTEAAPGYEVTDLLRKAHESPNIDPGTYEGLRDQAFDPETTRASFLKQVRDVDPETFKPARPPRPHQEERKALSLSKKLLLALEDVGELSPAAIEAVQSLIVELEEKLTLRKAA